MKRFFYACAAILCLTLAFHFGATSAQGQSNSFFEVIPSVNQVVVRVVDTIYQLNGSLGSVGWGALESLPTNAASVVYYDNTTLISSSGEAWAQAGGAWHLIQPVPGGATSVSQTTFGALKAKYR